MYVVYLFIFLIISSLFGMILFLTKFKADSTNIQSNSKLRLDVEETQQNNCYKKTGTYDGKSCICKHPDFLTNNHWNGNCDKIVDRNCKTITDPLTKNKMDFNKRDPYDYGICDCGDLRVYDTLLRKCVLKRVGDNVKYQTKDAADKCLQGYIYSNKYFSCIKDICSWDVLNPSIRIDGGNCDCDVTKGILPVDLVVSSSTGGGGCTKSITIQNHIIEDPPVLLILFRHNNSNEHKTTPSVSLLYPQVGVGSYFKNVLNFETSKDDGSTFLCFQHSQNERIVNRYLIDHNITVTTSGNDWAVQELKQPPLDAAVFLNELLSYPVEKQHPLISDSKEVKKTIPPVLLKEREVLQRIGEMENSVISSRHFIINTVDLSPLVVRENKEVIINPIAIEYNIFNSVLMFIYRQEGGVRGVLYKPLLL